MQYCYIYVQMKERSVDGDIEFAQRACFAVVHAIPGYIVSICTHPHIHPNFPQVVCLLGEWWQLEVYDKS